MTRVFLIALILWTAGYTSASHAQSCTIPQTSDRTGTTITIYLQTGCTPAAEETFGAAALFWADFLYSPVPITVLGDFKPLDCEASGGVLGSAGPWTAYANYSGLPDPGVFFPKALANSYHGADIDASVPDISMSYNNAIGTPGCIEYSSGWHFDDGSSATVPSGYIDLYGTVQHELGHGLGFLSYYSSAGEPAAEGGFTDSYSRYLYDEVVGQYIDYLSNASRASAFVRTGNLTWRGAAVDSLVGTLTAGATNGNVRMYAPNPYQGGSSVSHFDTELEPGELMEPIKLPRQQTNFPLTKNLFRDIGWKTLPDPPVLSSQSATGNSITVAVAAPQQTGGSAILNYTVTCGSQSATSASSTITVNGLQALTQYSCVATTNTAIGSSDPSSALVQSTTGSSDGSCFIEQKSDRTGTFINVNMATGCTADARETFAAAALYWADFIYSPVPINIDGDFKKLDCDANSAVLGSAGARRGLANFSGRPQVNTFYPIALANAFYGSDLYPSEPDIIMQYNNAIGTAGCLEGTSGWYLDDGSATSTPEGYIDLFGTVLHEIGHGLGVSSYYSESGNYPYGGFTDAYSQYLYNEATSTAVDDDTSDAIRYDAFRSQGGLTWSGAAVDAESDTLFAGTTNGNVRMYAPDPYRAGSSISHFDTELEPSDLMEPIKVARELTSVHLTRNLIRDIGWTTLPDPPTLALTGVSTDSLDFILSPPKQTGGATILNFSWECSSPDDANYNLSFSSPFAAIRLINLSQGVRYTCHAATNTAIGRSDISNVVTRVTHDVPRAFFASYEVGNEEITFRIGLAIDHGLPISLYVVECTDGVSTFRAESSSSNIVTLTGLKNGTAYSCSVSATNSVGPGPSSSATTGLIPEFTSSGLPIWLLYQATQ